MRRDALVSLVAGAALAAASLAAFWIHPQRPRLALQAGLHLVGGREAAIPPGIGAGLSWPTSFAAALALEWSMLLLGFPLLVLAGGALRRWRRARDALAGAEAFAARRPDAGVLTLGGVTLMPFLPIGALTSVLVGEVLRLPSWKLIPTLLAAELVANLTMALAAAAVLAWLPHPFLTSLALAAALLAAGAVVAVKVHRR